jgi:hypothetical protein
VRHVIALLAALLVLTGCEDRPSQSIVPPRASEAIVFAEEPSVVSVNLKVDLAGLERDLEARLPRRLWSIKRQNLVCVPSKKVDLALFKLKTPKLKCDIESEVTRGRLRLSTRGQDLTLQVPISAEVVARDIGGILKRETVTAVADLRLALRLDVRRDWQLKGDVAIDYSWSKEPGFDFLGQRIKLTEDADKALDPLRAKAEAGLKRALARVQLKAAAERGWRSAHTVLELNRENPAVWGRITPQRFYYGGYRIDGQSLWMILALEGKLESHVGRKPDIPEPGPLPALEWLAIKPGYALLRVPVVADYAVLEPVIAKALTKRAARPFELGEYGTVKARFDNIEVYGTIGNRIAVGVTFAAESDVVLWRKARGRLWISALPMTTPNSREVGFTDVTITGETDVVGEKLLLALANSDEFKTTIEHALKQNFEGDFAKLLGKIDRAIAFRKDGPVAYSVTIERINTGRIVSYGQGLHLPVELYARMNAELVKVD